MLRHAIAKSMLPKAASRATFSTVIARRKIGLIGGGNIGSTIALMAAQKQLANVVLFDIVKGMPSGKALDLCQTKPVTHTDFAVQGTNSYQDIKDSDVVIVTAGRPRAPGMTRDDLIAVNSPIVREVAEGIATYCPNAFVICITNPLDAMVQLLQVSSGLPTNMVCGMAGVLDTARLRFFLAERLNVSVEDVHAVVMGGHADTMVPIINSISVGGLRIPELIKMGLISQQEIEAIVKRTAEGGGEIVQLLGTSAFYAPAASAIAMAESYLLDKKRILPCAAHLSGQYGIKDVFVGVPTVIGAGGIETVLEYELTESEQVMLAKSVEAVRSSVAAIPPA
eukprot:GHVN01013836.1.p1 GENE.GHVN01013836.1~~GHVN01013836.1.p1  ORF type:complete len:338 (+),score=51.86 GHVN01013836.1:2134-3147(+)